LRNGFHHQTSNIKHQDSWCKDYAGVRKVKENGKGIIRKIVSKGMIRRA
jgi:hypothetical protein